MTIVPVERGYTWPLTFRFRNPDRSLLNLFGSEIVLTVTAPGRPPVEYRSPTRIVLSDTSPNEAARGTATLTLTPAESRAIPEGALTSWELERRVGGEQHAAGKGLLEGVGKGGNADV